MSGFQLQSAVILAIAILVCPIHWVLVARRRPQPGLGMKTVRRYSVWERLVHLGLLVSFTVLAFTGFYATIGWGGPMKGYTLMIHTTFGAVFAVTCGFMLLTWANDHAFGRSHGRFDCGQKLYFWLAGLLVLVALLTMLLSMINLFGTSGQALMYTLHRWATLVLLVATVWHVYATTLAKPGTLGSLVSGFVGGGWVERFHPLWGKGAGADPTRRS
jgi:formate dehydrogenase subunit gamma